ncbi:MAG: TIGR02530 family flagellar biosynthesis protein [Miltoncostaeaceae bacterium]
MSAEVSTVAGLARANRAGAATAAAAARNGAPAGGFDRLLEAHLQARPEAGAVRWSSHAVDRLTQRQISISPQMQQRLQGAVDDLAAKGARESLVLMDGVALVVSVANRTVITAVGSDRMRDQIFTNIDSAVVR